MILTGNEDHSIALTVASDWTKNFRDTNAVGAPIAHCFGKNAILDVLNQVGCVGMRIYYALDNLGDKQLIIVGVDAAGNDLYNGLLAEKSVKCPNMCSSANPLNT